MKDIDVLVIGRSCLDIIAVVEEFPREDTKVPILFRMMEGGGQGGTASCCIARLGGKVAYYGHLGNDEEGVFCLKRLKDFRVDTGFVEFVQDGKTPAAYLFITRRSGNRTIIYEHNTLPKLRADRLSEIFANRIKAVLIDPETTYLARDVKALAGNETRIVYDCERWREDIPDMMAVADYFIPSCEFLQTRELNLEGLPFEQRIFRLAEMINGSLVVTAGADGAYYVYREQLIHAPAPVVEVKDTTGAGDNFHAAFCMALCKGYDFSTAVKFSVAVASLSCRGYGGREGIPEATEAFALAKKLEESVVAKKQTDEQGV
jgi:sulfofructose kinase